MAIIGYALRVLIAAVTVVAAAELSRRYPRWGALLLSLPLISVLTFLMSWFQNHDMKTVSKLARETLVLVPLGLPFFIPFAYSQRLGLGFWTSFAAGMLLASLTIGAWMWFAPSA